MVLNKDNSELPSNTIPAIAFDSKGKLWVGTEDGLLMSDYQIRGKFTTEETDLPYNSIRDIVVDAHGALWIGTGRFGDSGGGLARFDGSTWTIYTNQNSGLPHNNVHALAIDAQGVIWIGTEQGLAKFDETAWSAYTPENSGLPHEWVWALAPDTQGNLWVGTRGGLAAYRQGGVLFPEKSTRGYDRKLVVHAMHSLLNILDITWCP